MINLKQQLEKITSNAIFYNIKMLNLNLMHINEDYSSSYEMQDSHANHQDSIRAENTYELNSNTDSEEGDHEDSEYKQSFEIDHSMDDLSVDHDTFLQTLQRERITDKTKTVPQKMFQFKSMSPKYLTVDKNSVEMTLIQTQSVQEVICFTNITSFSMKMKFNQCPFQIHTEKSLSFVQAKQVQIILEPFEEVSITFLIKSPNELFGDIIETVVVTSQFMGREESISPIQINFNIHYIEPKMKLKFFGKTDGMFLTKNRISVVRLKANKIGQYSLQIALNDGCPKMNVNVQTRGKMTCFTSNLTLSSQSYSSVKLRRKMTNQGDNEKYVLILKSSDTKLCFLIGVQFIA